MMALLTSRYLMSILLIDSGFNIVPDGLISLKSSNTHDSVRNAKT